MDFFIKVLRRIKKVLANARARKKIARFYPNDKRDDPAAPIKIPFMWR